MAWATALASGLRRLARIRYRLLLINLVVAAVPVVGIAFAEMHETQLLGALERDLIHQGQLVREVVATGALPADALERVLVRTARDTRTRIRVLDARGEVTADSHRLGPPEGAERAVPQLIRGATSTHAAEVPAAVALAERREVRAALAGRYGAATRLWDKQDRVYLFAALPVATAGAPGDAPAVTAVVYVTRSTQEVKLQLYRLRSWLSRLLAASIAGTALLSLLLATTIARPLGRLTRRAQRIAARQPVAPDTLAERSDEIGQLARAVAQMTDELERRARDARSLAADISHELKTPLASIRGAAELLRDGAADEPDARERFLAMIVDDVARLDRQVSRLLELARVDDDRTTALPVDLAALARACAARAWPCPVAVAIVGSCDATVPGRAALLATALDNLVANATQHAAPGTAVDIVLSRTTTGVELAVRNRGPALSAAAQRQVWDRFYSTRTAVGGTGLGLAIVRSIALGHGGRVSVACAGGVTTFAIELPT